MGVFILLFVNKLYCGKLYYEMLYITSLTLSVFLLLTLHVFHIEKISKGFRIAEFDPRTTNAGALNLWNKKTSGFHTCVLSSRSNRT
jgi:hypothetical protein